MSGQSSFIKPSTRDHGDAKKDTVEDLKNMKVIRSLVEEKT